MVEIFRRNHDRSTPQARVGSRECVIKNNAQHRKRDTNFYVNTQIKKPRGREEESTIVHTRITRIVWSISEKELTG